MADPRMDDERTLLKIPELVAEKRQFREAVIGQDGAVEAFAGLLGRIRSGIRSKRAGPIAISFLAGPSGVGKTEIVNRLAEIIGGGPEAKVNDPNLRSKVIVINGGEYQERHAINRLLGSPPGYIGSEDSRWPGGTKPVFSQENLDAHQIVFTSKDGKQNGVVIILVDEAEKADAALHRAFLSVLDKGEMRLANNEAVDFKNAVIFYTSNVGNNDVEKLRAAYVGIGDEVDVEERAKELMAAAFKNAFPPEFRGRVEDLVIFEPLKPAQLEKIATLQLKDVEEDFWESGIDIQLELTAEAMKLLLERGYNPSEGARALRKVVKREIADQLSRLDRKELNKATILIDVAEQGESPFVFYGGIDKNRIPREKTFVPRPTLPLGSGARATSVQRIKPAVTTPRSETERNKLVAQDVSGATASTESASGSPLDPLVTALRKDSSEYGFGTELKRWVNAGWTIEKIGRDPRIIQVAKDRVIAAYEAPRGSSNYAPSHTEAAQRESKDLVKLGIGTHEGYMQALEDYKELKRAKLIAKSENLREGRETLDSSITDPVRTALRNGIKDYKKAVAKAVSGGSVTAEQIGTDPRILEIARDRVKRTTGGLFGIAGSPRSVGIEVERLVAAGIGTMDDYADIIEETTKNFR